MRSPDSWPIVYLCVFCSSSKDVDPSVHDLARSLGRRIAERGDKLVYGGTPIGVMGTLAESARDGGAPVIGVVPRLFVDRGYADEETEGLEIVEDMARRKDAMVARSDAFLALPGGFGTLDELLEVLTLKQLGYHRKPVVLIGYDGFWEPLLELFDRLIDDGFARPAYRGLLHHARDLADAFDHLDTYDPEDLPVKRW